MVQIETLGNSIGVCLIMFSLGLELKLTKIKQFLGASLVGAFGVLMALVALFAFVGNLYGSNLNVSFLLGATVSLSSTTGILFCLDFYYLIVLLTYFTLLNQTNSHSTML